jgi:8-amino-7-oxononanoate synthase
MQSLYKRNHHQNLLDLLQWRAEISSENNGYIFLKDGETDEEHLSYRELERKARAVASHLQKTGAKGERVLLLFAPGLNYIIGYFACLMAGAIAVPVYPPHPRRLNQSFSRLMPILKNSNPKFVLTNQKIVLASKILTQFSPILKKLHWVAIERVNENEGNSWKNPDPKPEDIAFLQYTSGSTGDPKGVMVSHQNLLHNLNYITKKFGVSENDTALVWVPPYHDMGLIGGIIEPVFSGLNIILMSPMDFLKKPKRWLEAVSHFQATISGGPNFSFELCARKMSEEEKSKLDLRSWRVAFTGAEPVRYEMMERFSKAFRRSGFRKEIFYPTYGLAESTLMVSGGETSKPPKTISVCKTELKKNKVKMTNIKNTLTFQAISCGSGGSAFGEIKIVDPDTKRELGEDSVGEIWLSSPSVAKGYWERPLETQETFKAKIIGKRKPYLRTGDLGFVHEGDIYITGRLKDLIIIRGKNYYPQEIETTVYEPHRLLRAGGTVVFGIDDGHEESLIVVSELVKGVSLKTNSAELNETFKIISKSILKEHGLRTSEIVLIEGGSLFKTSSGKLQRRKTKQQYLSRSLKAIQTFRPSQKTDGTADVGGERAQHQNRDAQSKKTNSEETLFRIVSTESAYPLNSVTLDSHLTDDLNMDSLMVANICHELEERFPRFPTEKVSSDMLVRDLLQLVPDNVPSNFKRDQQLDSSRTPLSESYEFERFPEIHNLNERLEVISLAGTRNPYFSVNEKVSTSTIVVNGRGMINFSGYNYLGNSGDPRVSLAAKKAIGQYGTSVSASRLASGEIPLHRQLEEKISSFIGTEDALVFVAGHATNVSTIGHLLGPKDLILHDELSHDSIIQGAKLSGAQRRPFRHNDQKHLEELLTKLRAKYRRVLIIIEGIYSMDGDIPSLPDFVRLKKKHKALLMVDEAHSIGVLGKSGKGITEHFQIPPSSVDILMGTLSKSLASCGGYIAAKSSLIQYLRYTAPAFVYSVGISPPNAAAAIAALENIEREPERISLLRERSKYFLDLAKKAGLNTGPSQNSPVIPVIIGDSVLCLKISEALAEKGISAHPILYPAIAENSTRIRFFLSANHTKKQIEQTIEALATEINSLQESNLSASLGFKKAV